MACLREIVNNSSGCFGSGKSTKVLSLNTELPWLSCLHHSNHTLLCSLVLFSELSAPRCRGHQGGALPSVEGQHRAASPPLQAFLSVVVSSLLVASKYNLLPGAARRLSEGTTLGCWFVKLKIFPAAAIVLLEEVFQVKCLGKLQEETGFVQVMVLAMREGSRGAMSPGLSSPCIIQENERQQILFHWANTCSFERLFFHADMEQEELLLSSITVFLPGNQFSYQSSGGSCASEHVLYGEGPTRILIKLFPGGYSGSRYATLGSNVMHRAEAAHCGMLGGSPTIFSEQISAVMSHPLLEEGAGTSGEISWREKWWRDVKEHFGYGGGVQQLNVEESVLGAGGRQVKKSQGKSCFFSRGAFCLVFVAVCTSREEGWEFCTC